MRLMTLAISLLSVVTLIGCASSGSGGEETFEPSAAELRQEEGFLTQTAPLAERTATLEVRGLSCPKCASNVDLTLARVKGVQSVEQVDLSNGTVRLALAEEGRPSPAELARAVKRSGFTLVGISTP